MQSARGITARGTFTHAQGIQSHCHNRSALQSNSTAVGPRLAFAYVPEAKPAPQGRQHRQLSPRLAQGKILAGETKDLRKWQLRFAIGHCWCVHTQRSQPKEGAQGTEQGIAQRSLEPGATRRNESHCPHRSSFSRLISTGCLSITPLGLRSNHRVRQCSDAFYRDAHLVSCFDEHGRVSKHTDAGRRACGNQVTRLPGERLG